MNKGRIIRLTEEQVKRLGINEDVQIKANLEANGGDVKKAVDNAKREAQAAGINKEKMEIVVDANESQSRDGFHINESQVFTINDLFKRK